MNPFNQRWQTLAQQARSLGEEPLPELPFGFATRIIALSKQSPAETFEELLNAFGLRALFVTLGIGLIGAGFVFSDWYDFRIERPKMEQTLTSELSWP